MGFSDVLAVASFLRPTAVLSVASNRVLPVRRRRLFVPSITCLVPRCLRMKMEQNSWRELHLKSEFNGGSLIGRQSGRRLIPGAANYQRSRQSQPEGTPAWFWLINQLLSWASSAVHFLFEQPGQLQHIEWPTLHTIVRMAVLTLIVVTCLIVLLATMDSTMSYVLASLLRRVP
ncbi:hypothetical protein Mapa_015525 [Marchantia paleacea]|nr:hypothetical protein Mapa_015525 [Marchantia paleacea]